MLDSTRPAHSGLAVVLRGSWLLLRLPVLALLVVLEPVVRILLAGSALLITLMAFFFALVRPMAAFPFWGMLLVAIGCFAALTVYGAVIRFLSD